MRNNIKLLFYIIASFVLGYLLAKKVSFEKPSYSELPQDYYQNELGLIKKGTKLKYDKGMSEGFSRYILYINISDGDNLQLKKSENFNEINPYWIEKKE